MDDLNTKKTKTKENITKEYQDKARDQASSKIVDSTSDNNKITKDNE
jgi:hypothetical protein